MALRRGSHSVYDTQYHLVWAPKYRKKILTGAVGERIRELFLEIGEAYGIEIEELEVSVDHVPIFCSYFLFLSSQVVDHTGGDTSQEFECTHDISGATAHQASIVGR